MAVKRYGMTREQAIASLCPDCLAKPGEECMKHMRIDVLGARPAVHQARYQLAFRNSPAGKDWCAACLDTGCELCGR